MSSTTSQVKSSRIVDLHDAVIESMATPMNLIIPATDDGLQGALYLGHLGASVDLPLLSSKNISHIVQVLDVPWVPLEDEGLKYHRVDIEDKPTTDLKPHLEGVITFIRTNLGEGNSILVHCHQGVSRSASMIIAYLIQEKNMTYEEALQFTRDQRLCVKPNPGFEKCLRNFELEVRRQGQGAMEPAVLQESHS